MDKRLDIKNLQEWQALASHQLTMRGVHLKQLFAAQKNRFQQFSLSTAGILLDYSRNHCDTTTIQLLCRLAERCGLSQAIQDLFNGAIVNGSEQRPALHTALRRSAVDEVWVTGQNIMPQVHEVLLRMEVLADQIRDGHYLGYSGQPIRHIVNIGIGGSDLGPKMAVYALQPQHHATLRFHFVSNADHRQIRECLLQCDPATTLFIVSSKTFMTQETLNNFQYAKNWLQYAAGTLAIEQHFVAVTAAVDKAVQLGFNKQNVLPFWSWVGGRHSIWSAVSLSLVIAIGMQNFKAFLAGAAAMDAHFMQAPFTENMPVLLALLGIWYNNFYHCQTQVVIPYYQGFKFLPDYLQQLCMESLGKCVRQDGQAVDYATGGIVWGGQGTNSQHNFHQMLLQGTQMVPADFILPLKITEAGDDHKEMIANCLAQSEVFYAGYVPDTVDAALRPHIIIRGNCPHNLLLLDHMGPGELGALLALYEHKVYVQSVIWQINAFDQWGVQRAKQLADSILERLREHHPSVRSSDEELINVISGMIHG